MPRAFSVGITVRPYAVVTCCEPFAGAAARAVLSLAGAGISLEIVDEELFGATVGLGIGAVVSDEWELTFDMVVAGSTGCVTFSTGVARS